jgi:surface antigen
MRTFRGNAPIIIGAGALVLSLFAPASPPLKAEDGANVPAPQVTAALPEAATSLETPLTLAELRAKLDASDRAVALKALELALTELGDGTTLLWRRPARQLAGAVRPVSAFRDDSGRLCRHVIYALTLGSYAKQAEGIACRGTDGHWSLQG